MKQRRLRKRIYVYGSAAPALRPEADERRRKRKKALDEEWKRNFQAMQERLEKKPASRGIGANIFFAVSLIMTVFLCISFISVGTRVDSTLKRLEKKKSELETLRINNDALENRIDTVVDLDKIYTVAVEEMGMVYPENGQVITYDHEENGYVRQYESIPEY